MSIRHSGCNEMQGKTGHLGEKAGKRRTADLDADRRYREIDTIAQRKHDPNSTFARACFEIRIREARHVVDERDTHRDTKADPSGPSSDPESLGRLPKWCNDARREWEGGQALWRDK